MITVSRLRRDGLITNTDKLVGFENVPENITCEIIYDILKRVNSVEFQKDPNIYISAYSARRGPTRELRIPDDISLQFIKKHLSYLKGKMK